MISSYRIHQEQILKVAESLNAPYQKKTGKVSIVAEKTKSAPKRPVPAHRTRPAVQKPTQQPETECRCHQCNAGIPKMDYLYTQKTGLCISCWEKMEA